MNGNGGDQANELECKFRYAPFAPFICNVGSIRSDNRVFCEAVHFRWNDPRADEMPSAGFFVGNPSAAAPDLRRPMEKKFGAPKNEPKSVKNGKRPMDFPEDTF